MNSSVSSLALGIQGKGRDHDDPKSGVKGKSFHMDMAPVW